MFLPGIRLEPQRAGITARAVYGRAIIRVLCALMQSQTVDTTTGERRRNGAGFYSAGFVVGLAIAGA